MVMQLCTLCRRYFPGSTCLHMHQKTHHKTRLNEDIILKCSYCSGVFHEQSSLEEHVRFFHLEEECLICGAVSVGAFESYEHIGEFHSPLYIPGNILWYNKSIETTYRTLLLTFLSSMLPEKPILLIYLKVKKKCKEIHFSLIACTKDSNMAEVCCTLIGYTVYNYLYKWGKRDKWNKNNRLGLRRIDKWLHYLIFCTVEIGFSGSPADLFLVKLINYTETKFWN